LAWLAAFPVARDLKEFWENLRAGRDCVTDYTDEELLAAGVDPALLSDPGYVKSRFAMDDADLFDAAHFGISPVEADVTDPQQRVLLECAREALDDAGYDASTFDGPIGMYAGAAFNTYYASNLRSESGCRRPRGLALGRAGQ